MKTANQHELETGRPTMRAIDFFCGAGGMSYGLMKAGIEVVAGLDLDQSCQATFEHNVKGAQFLAKDVTRLSVTELIEALEIKENDDSLILTGCSPCQFWSKINTDRSKSRQSAFLLKEFARFVIELRPGWLAIENVPGIVNKRGSVLPDFLRILGKSGYTCAHAVINLSHFGIPQTRQRFVLIANRLGISSDLPTPLTVGPATVRSCLGKANGFMSIKAGHRDQTSFMHTASGLSPINLSRIEKTPTDGGKRSAWNDDPNLALRAYEGRESQFSEVYSRMSWDKPAPTITTRFNSFSNGRFGHPEELRAISLREGATLQTFPKTYRFFGSMPVVARHIGNAVPPAFAKLLGQHILQKLLPAHVHG